MTGWKPFVKTSRVKFLFASWTTNFWHLISGPMKDEKANVTLLHPFKPSVDIFLPQSQSINYRSILMLKRNNKILLFAPKQQTHCHMSMQCKEWQFDPNSKAWFRSRKIIIGKIYRSNNYSCNKITKNWIQIKNWGQIVIF